MIQYYIYNIYTYCLMCIYIYIHILYNVYIYIYIYMCTYALVPTRLSSEWPKKVQATLGRRTARTGEYEELQI